MIVDEVNQPKHYADLGFSYEVIEMMEAIWGKEKLATFCEINAFKYKMRAGSKHGQSPEKDLAKAEWYLNKVKKLRES